MSTDFEETSNLVKDRRLVQARRKLLALRDANARVWGLDKNIELVEQALLQIERSIIEARERLAQADVTGARILLKNARQAVVDHEELDSLLAKTKAQSNRAIHLAEAAAKAMGERNLTSAWQLIDEAASVDRGNERIGALKTQIQEAYGQHASEQQAARRLRRLSAVIVTVIISALGVGLYLFIASMNAESAKSAALAKAREKHIEAHERINSEKYAEAERLLSEALETLRSEGLEHERLFADIRETFSSEPVTKGVAGLVPLGDAWVTPDERQSVLRSRQALRVQVESLKTAIKTVRDKSIGRDVPETGETFEASVSSLLSELERLSVLIDVKENEVREGIRALETTCEATFQKHGLRKRQGQWMTEEEAFALDQQEKGLVLYEDEWVTPEVKLSREMMAKGLVLFEGEWVTPAEKQRRQTELQEREARERAAREAQARLEQSRAEQEAMRKAIGSYRDFAVEAKKIRAQFTAGITFQNYDIRLASLIDALALIEDDISPLRKKADAVLEGCNLVRSMWRLKLQGRATDSQVSETMSTTSLLIDSFLASYEAIAQD